MPHLDLLLVPAYPTQYWSTPTGFSSVTIAEGMTLFPQHCAVCHGAQGRGDGPAAASLPIPPANLTQPHLWAHPDGELFWWVSHGIEAPDRTLVMPGFASVLTEDQRWALIDWVRANNAGLARVASGGWTTPVHAPAFDITCADRNASDLADLRGQVVRIVFGPAKAIPGAVTLATDPGTRPSAGLCAADDGAVSTAYAVVTGLDREALRGAEVLVDGQGWLRSVLQRTPGDGGDNGEIASAIRAIERQPLAAAPMTHAGMKM
jgi:hypothetical protein